MDFSFSPYVFDALVFALLFAAGLFAVFSYRHAHDFLSDDVSYFESARSLLETGFYGFNGQAEANQPPGLPAILVAMCSFGLCTYGAFLGAMAVFEALGFAATYLLFRRQAGQGVAASICLLLVACPLYFTLATRWVSTTFVFFFFATSALLVVDQLERAQTTVSRLQWGVVLSALTTTAMLVASAGLSLLVGIAAKVVIAFRGDRRLGWSHLKTYSMVLLLGLAFQGWWMHRKPTRLEWPLPGYPRPYLEQLKIKSGPRPELGYATWKDLALRIGRNLRDEVVMLLQSVSPVWINPTWWSVALAGPILLALLGWSYRVWQARGDTVQEWFFAAYQAIYLFWPWKMDPRYFLPVAPLVCLYLWYGANAFHQLAKRRSRLLGAAWLPVSALLVAASLVWLPENHGFARFAQRGLQLEVSLAVWLLSGIVAGWMVFKDFFSRVQSTTVQ